MSYKTTVILKQIGITQGWQIPFYTKQQTLSFVKRKINLFLTNRLNTIPFLPLHLQILETSFFLLNTIQLLLKKKKKIKYKTLRQLLAQRFLKPKRIRKPLMSNRRFYFLKRFSLVPMRRKNIKYTFFVNQMNHKTLAITQQRPSKKKQKTLLLKYVHKQRGLYHNQQLKLKRSRVYHEIQKRMHRRFGYKKKWRTIKLNLHQLQIKRLLKRNLKTKNGVYHTYSNGKILQNRTTAGIHSKQSKRFAHYFVRKLTLKKKYFGHKLGGKLWLHKNHAQYLRRYLINKKMTRGHTFKKVKRLQYTLHPLRNITTKHYLYSIKNFLKVTRCLKSKIILPGFKFTHALIYRPQTKINIFKFKAFKRRRKRQLRNKLSSFKHYNKQKGKWRHRLGNQPQNINKKLNSQQGKSLKKKQYSNAISTKNTSFKNSKKKYSKIRWKRETYLPKTKQTTNVINLKKNQ